MTGKKEKEKKEKEIERLKWEYLKRSENYRKFCIEMQKRMTKGGWISMSAGDEFYDVLVKMTCENPMHGGRIKTYPLFALFKQYGDVHSKSFIDYFKSKDSSQDYAPSFKPVKDYTDEIGQHIDLIAYWFREQNAGREPNIIELKKYLIDYMKHAHPAKVYLRIYQSPFTYQRADELSRQVAMILKKRIPKKRFVKEELERYLRVYDMRNNNPPISYREIHKKEFPKINFTEHTRRARVSDFNKAKKIIENIENDKFFYW